MQKKYIAYAALGIAAGILTGYLRAFRSASFWSLSDIAARYGFWILTVSLIAYYAGSEKNAAGHSFSYMMMMCISYYAYLYLEYGILYKKELAAWGIFAGITSIFAKFLYKANHGEMKYGMAVNYIPITLLGLEFADLLYLFVNYGTNFTQMAFDFAGVILLFALFTREQGKRYRRRLFLASAASVGIVCFTFMFVI